MLPINFQRTTAISHDVQIAFLVLCDLISFSLLDLFHPSLLINPSKKFNYKQNENNNGTIKTSEKFQLLIVQ